MIGLPSLHALDDSQGPRIWLATETTDMRCGFDRLAERVKSVIGQDPSGNSLFVFRSRRGDRLKILTWDRDGFVLWYKRLESGVFKAPRLDAGTRSVELRASELAMILDGIDMSKLKRVPRYERSSGTNKINPQKVFPSTRLGLDCPPQPEHVHTHRHRIGLRVSLQRNCRNCSRPFSSIVPGYVGQPWTLF